VFIPNLLHQFVSIHTGTPRTRVGTGLVMGYQFFAPCGIYIHVYELTEKKTRVVSGDDLAWIPAHDVITPATVKGLRAEHPEFGRGLIVSAQRPCHMMQVWLRGPNDTESGWLPLDQVAVLGPPVSL
jgi:hypothetical protein